MRATAEGGVQLNAKEAEVLRSLVMAVGDDDIKMLNLTVAEGEQVYEFARWFDTVDGAARLRIALSKSAAGKPVSPGLDSDEGSVSHRLKLAAGIPHTVSSFYGAAAFDAEGNYVRVGDPSGGGIIHGVKALVA